MWNINFLSPELSVSKKSYCMQASHSIWQFNIHNSRPNFATFFRTWYKTVENCSILSQKSTWICYQIRCSACINFCKQGRTLIFGPLWNKAWRNMPEIQNLTPSAVLWVPTLVSKDLHVSDKSFQRLLVSSFR